ncbi:NAD-dependent epimerase/dehydratase family protein [Nakamurella alba]|uniref:NAD-dependent epimerase/dehydratase family protein n=1 Tax=Nakamurella alba TaxID=2665158 RepID=UPI003898E018
MTRFIGSALAGLLASRPDVDRVIGVDAVLPEPAARARMEGAEFARADIRNPLIGRIIEAAGVDTVVHASASATPASSAARTMAKEMNVLGTMQLLAACQRATSVQHLVVRSTAKVYGGSSKDPAVLTEDTTARSLGSGTARDAVDIEGYVRGFARRRPDVRVTVPRFAEVIGPTVHTPLTRYFSHSPVIAVAAGRDGRLQLLHESDAVAVLEHLALGSWSGIVNVAGEGALTVVQAVHRAGRIPLPVPMSALDGVGLAMRIGRLGGFSAATVRSLVPGRVLDTSRLRDEVGFHPAFTTVEAFDDFARTLHRTVGPSTIGKVERTLTTVLGLGSAAPAGTGIDPLAPVVHPPESGGTGAGVGAAAGPGAATSVVDDTVGRAAERPGRPHLVGIDGGSPRRRKAAR